MSSIHTRRLSPTDASLALAADLIRAGEVVALPTETVYGLAADATSEAAVARIYAAKGRPSHNPLIVHVGDDFRTLGALEARRFARCSALEARGRRTAQALIERFWPGPLTIVLPRGDALPAAVAGGLATVGFRMPSHPLFQDVLGVTGRPLAAPSANRSARISPTRAEHVAAELDGRIPLILDDGPTALGLESTIVSVDADGSLSLLRPGSLPVEEIAAVASVRPPEGPSAKPLAPGMSREHYAPGKPLLLRTAGDDDTHVTQRLAHAGARSVGTLGLRAPLALDARAPQQVTVALSLEDPGDGRVAARRLFEALRELDAAPIDAIVAELPPEGAGGLWPAIADRLRRAGARWSSVSQ